MSAKSARPELDVVREVADRYRQQGFRVNVRPQASNLPVELRSFQVDLLATRDDDQVIVEVKRGKTTREVSRQLAQLTEVANSLGFRVDLVSEPDLEEPNWPRPRRRSLLRDALELLRDDRKEAAVLIAASALEGALRPLASRYEVSTDRQTSIRQLIDLLRSNGVIGPNTSVRLSRLAEARNQAAHAMSMGRISAEEIRSAIDLALWLDEVKFATPDQMADWFFDRFEDPAEWVPYDSAEGGYQYPKGEPHDARDVLADRYSAAPEEAIEDAVELIEPLGTEWVRKGRH